MDAERWQALVRRLEPRARENPKAYQRKVVLLAALGYASIATLLLALLAIAVLLVVLAVKGHAILLVKLIFPIAALGWVIARSLWVTFDPPEGVPLRRADVPELVRMIEETRKAIDGPKVHQVLLVADANAAIVQIPRAGGLFGARNYLLLGLAYMQALSPEQFRGVVAHELGHLSHAHGRFGSFVYRVRGTWFQLLEGLHARGSWITGLVTRFFAWYVPYFDAYTFPIQRAHELAADDAAASVVGPEAVASGLVAGALSARWLHETYWPAVYDRAADEAMPPTGVFAPLARELPAARHAAPSRRWFRELLEEETDVADSHPAVRERIEHLGLDPEQVYATAVEPPAKTAAEAYLGGAEHALVDAVAREWAKEIENPWREQHAEAQKAKRELERLEARDDLSDDEALTRAHLTASFRTEDEALARYRELVGTASDAPARFGVGKLLLARGDEEGLRWLDEAMERDPDATLPACEIAWEFLRERERDGDAERYRARAEQHAELLEKADEERSSVSVDDELEPPALPSDLIDRIRQKVEWHEEIAAAYIVRKKTEHLDEEHPFHVVAVVPKSTFKSRWNEADDDVEPLEVRVSRDLPFDEDEVMVARVGEKSPLAQRFAAIDGARLFSRD